MDKVKVYCCVPVKFRDNEKIKYEIATVQNYWLSLNPTQKNNVEFVTNFVESGHSRDYSLSDRDFKNAAIEELTVAIDRLMDCDVVVFHPDFEADDACKTIHFMVETYQFKTRYYIIGR